MGNTSGAVRMVRSDASRGYPENQRLVFGKITFVFLNVHGSNNNKYATPEKSDGVLCPPSLNDIDAGCRAARAEYVAGDAAVASFLHDSFILARLRINGGVLVMIQADIFSNTTTSTGALATKVGYENFWSTLRSKAQSSRLPVALVHGDGHVYRQYSPDASVSNLIDVEVPGNRNIGWVLAEIDSASKNVFAFTHVDLIGAH